MRKKSLIPEPARFGQYRVYQESDIELVQLITEDKALGIPLSKLKEGIRIENGVVDWHHIRQSLLGIKQGFYANLHQVQQKVAQLERCMNAH